MHDDTRYASDDHLPPLPDYLADMEPDPILADETAEYVASQDEMPNARRTVVTGVLGLMLLVLVVIVLVDVLA